MIEPCPYLPTISETLSAASMRAVGRDRGIFFYQRALCYAQSLWMRGYAARALLLLNRAMGADLSGEEEWVRRWPMPYRACAWMLRHRRSEQFIGNPRLHYQHLATRMVEPRRELRSWRAWACWGLARAIMPELEGDPKQPVCEPKMDEIEANLSRLGLPGEGDLWREALREFS